MVDGNKLNAVLEFTYLGSTISSNGCIDGEIQRRMAKASASFDRLRQRLWNNHHVSMRVKDKIYRAIVLSTLLYGAEAWTNKKILERTGLPSTEDLLWTGHLMRMSPDQSRFSTLNCLLVTE